MYLDFRLRGNDRKQGNTLIMWKKLHKHIHGKNKNKSFIGIDIDSESVSAIELESTHKNTYIVKSFYLESIKNNQLEEGNNSLTTSLETIVTHLQIENKYIATALPYSSVISKQIDINKHITEKEIENFLSLNSKKYFGHPIEELNIDYQITGKNKNHYKKDILNVIATRKEQIEKYLLAFKMAKLLPNIVDVDIFALARSSKKYIIDKQEPTAVIQIDKTRLLICVFKNDTIIHSHSDYITNKHQNTSPHTISEIISDVQIGLAPCQMPIKKAIISGAYSASQQLIQLLSQELDIEVITVNPFVKMWLAPEINEAHLYKIAPFMMISLGLAMRRIPYG